VDTTEITKFRQRRNKEDDEYNRFMSCWQEWAHTMDNNRSTSSVVRGTTATLTTAVSIEVPVAHGQLSIFSPLASTMDQPLVRRILERFLDFKYHGMSAEIAFKDDYDSMTFQFTWTDFEATKVRSSKQQRYVIISRAPPSPLYNVDENESNPGVDLEPLFAVRVAKNAPG
jgi:hypothetical protein